MKNLIKFFMVMAVLCMTACSQTFEDVSNNAKPQEKGLLVMNVGSRSRTIMPTVDTLKSNIKSATLTVSGTRIRSWSGDNGDNVINQIESDNNILLDVGTYSFEMVFCNENSDVILIGTINNQEIKTGDNELTFDMQISTTGEGNISITLTWDVASRISKIKAGLYNIDTGEAVKNYEPEVLTISDTQSTYSKDNVSAGQYIIKFEVYDVSDKLLNTLTDVIEVIGGITTTDQITLNKINTQYTITYNLDGGNWQNGFTPITKRNANTKVTLPTADKINKTGTNSINYILVGWYDGNGDKITEIPSDTTGDIIVTAGWGITADTVAAAIKALSGEGSHNIIVTGAITSDTISAITTALQESSAKVNLDLSGTTGLTTIYNYMFSNCSNLTGVTIPDSVTQIWSGAFKGCSSLTAFNVSANNANFSTSDDGKILYNKDKTTLIAYPSATGDVTIPVGVTEIGGSAFFGCTGLTSVKIPDSVITIGDQAFRNCTGLTSVEIPDSVTTIGGDNGGYVFSGCTGLTSVKIGDSVTTIGFYAFSGCSSLASMTIGNSVTTIRNDAFNGCVGLTSVTIGGNVTEIGNDAFNGCTGLTSVEIPDSVTFIGNSVFSGCSSLTTVNYKGTQEELEKITDINQFGNATINYYSFKVKSDNVSTKISGLGEGSYTIIVTGEISDATISDIKGALRSNSNAKVNLDLSETTGLKEIVGSAFFACKSLTSVTIGNSVESIGKEAFQDCKNLTSVTIGNGVTSIGDEAFYFCKSLTNVTIGNGVTSIGDSAFYNCSSLTSVTIPDSVTSIGNDAFDNCSSLTSVTIGNSVTSIGNEAFYFCKSLTSVIIPDSVTSIGDWAFYNCSSLASVTFEDTSTWYYTEDENYTGGTVVDVTDSGTNATNLKSTYYNKYWYKQ